jgi:hypothetical protein
MNGAELKFSNDEILAGKPRQLALQLPPPYNFALEKALRRHVAARTASAMELWRDLSSATALLVAPQAEQMALPTTSPVQDEHATSQTGKM